MEQARLSYRHLVSIVVLSILMLVLAGCIRTEQVSTLPGGKRSVTPSIEVKNEITIWAFSEHYVKLAEQFKKEYKDVDIHVKVIPYSDHAAEYLQALVDGEAPDIMEVDHAFLGEFSVIDGLVNLKAKPYEAESLKKYISASLWNAVTSFDNERLFALPMSTSPMLTYYRKDIMEKYGFPSEPEALGTYLEDPERVLAMAEILKQEGIYMMLHESNPIEWAEAAVPLFDGKYQFNRYHTRIKTALLLSQQVRHNNLYSNISIRTKRGDEVIRTGRQAMVYMGTWGEQYLEQIAPDTKGLWHVTRLPLNLYGFSGSTSLMMSKTSSNKDLAWTFMKFAFESMHHADPVPAYLPSRKKSLERNHTSEFLGGQLAQSLYIELAGKVKEYRPTPFDVSMDAKYKAYRTSAIYNNENPDKALQQMEYSINTELKQSRKILLDALDARRS